MIIDVLYNNTVNSQIVMSYINDKMGVDLMHFNVSEHPHQFTKFVYTQGGGTGLQNYISHDNKPTHLEYASRFNRFDLMYFINNLPEEQKEKLLGFKPIKFFSFDIETEILDEFPDAETAKTPVVSIALCADDDKLTTRVMTIDKITEEEAKRAEQIVKDYIKENYDPNLDIDVKFVQLVNEEDMLKKFLVAYRQIPAIGGWYSDGYDFPYLIKRMAKYNLDMRSASLDGTVDQNGLPNHKLNIDYMELFKKYDYSLRPYESFKIDYVGNKSMNLKKLTYEGTLKQLRVNDIAKFLAYNAIDTIIVNLLHRKHNLLNVLNGLALVTTLPMRQCGGAVAQAEAVMFKSYLDKNYEGKQIIVCPERIDKPIEFEYDGGFVKDPTQNMGKYMACFDYSSLYPSVMRTMNLSPMNILGGGRILSKEEQLKYKGNKDYVISAQGRLYDNRTTSTYKETQSSLYKKRKEYQGDMFFYLNKVYFAVLQEEKRRGLRETV